MNNLPNTMNNTPIDLIQFYTYEVVGKIINFIPYLLLALAFIILGYFVAWIFEFFVRWLILRLNINKFLSDLGFKRFLEKANVELKSEYFLGRVVFWIIFLLFLITAFDILGLSSFSQLLTRVIEFLPKVLVSAFIFIFAIFLGDFLKRAIFTFLRGLETKGAELGSEIVYYSIFIFGLILALSHLGVAAEILNILVAGIILAFALAFGLSFGLGGQETAKHFLEDLKRKL